MKNLNTFFSTLTSATQLSWWFHRGSSNNLSKSVESQILFTCLVEPLDAGNFAACLF